MKILLDNKALCFLCRGGGVVIALASRSTVQIKRLDRRQVSQWAFGLAGVRIPSPAPFYQMRLISSLFWKKDIDFRLPQSFFRVLFEFYNTARARAMRTTFWNPTFLSRSLHRSSNSADDNFFQSKWIMTITLLVCLCKSGYMMFTHFSSKNTLESCLKTYF